MSTHARASLAGKQASAVYEGVVRHRRHAPAPHHFDYRIAQLYIDLDELDSVFQDHWLWTAKGRNVAEFRRSDYLGPDSIPLAEAVRRRVELATGMRPDGPIRLLTHLRYFGYAFNPVSFYYCYLRAERDRGDCTTNNDATNALGNTTDRLGFIVAEITNTWGERHAYVLPVGAARQQGRALHWDFPKAFHVSPFLPMDRDYRWSFTTPGADLLAHMEVWRHDACDFDATLSLRRRPLTSASLARVLWRYPAMTARVMAAIHWQALRLWVKGNRVYEHPQPNKGIQ